jgi:protein farnesyltransferase/geranylgeranyltransferase type-1 subunit alpha
MNPAHYTVWLYRARTLFELGSDLNGELEWLNEMAMSYQKNYQIWHHRNLIVDKLGDTKGDEETRAELIKGEQAFVERMFEADAKNYHVWSYRQWLVKRFALWEGWGELEFTERMVGKDVRNNSAWNHRWYMINGSPAATAGGGVKGDARIREREVTFAKEAIRKAPQNHSPWNYLRGIMRASGGGDGMRLAELREFLQEFAALDGEVTSSHALDLLADVYADEEEESGKIRAAQALDLLANKYDPIRKNYWEYRKGLLGLPTVGIVA